MKEFYNVNVSILLKIYIFKANAPQPGSLAPRTLAQHIDEFGRENLLKFSKEDLKKFFETKLNTLHGTK